MQENTTPTAEVLTTFQPGIIYIHNMGQILNQQIKKKIVIKANFFLQNKKFENFK